MKKLFLLLAVCCVFVSANAFAASPIRLIGFEAGYVSPDVDGLDAVDGTWVAGAFLDFGLPATNLYISPFVNYWNSSTDIPGITTSDEFNLRDIALGANVKFTIPTASVKFQPFIAAGVAAHMLNAEIQTSGLSADESDTKIGFQGGAGFKVGLNQSMNLLTSGWYSMVEDTNHWSLRAGLGWNM
jgi:opacity protein-like surface antigen